VIVLFQLTNGAIQISSGFIVKDCLTTVRISDLPQGLVPPPPEGANHAFICTSSLLGFVTARWLTVERVTHEGNVTTARKQEYRLGADRKPTNAYDVDWIVSLGLLIYLVTWERRYGATVGQRQLGLRVVDVAQPAQVGIPLRKAVMRSLFLWAPMLPVLAVAIAAALLIHTESETLFDDFFFWLTAAGLFAAFIYGWIVIDIVRKRDPLYDEMAGTAVVRI
jgi:hypothetical protein